VLRSYLPALVFLILGGAIGFAFSIMNVFFGRRRPGLNKDTPYECGLPSEVQRGFRFGISFYLVAMLFILFDIEVVFMYPWAVVYKDMLAEHATRNLILGSMLSFILILFAGYLYALKKDAFNWRS
jgi:NADH-quinone oxidoreductase subunit A